MGLYNKSVEKAEGSSSVQKNVVLEKKADAVQKDIAPTKPVASFRTDIDKFYHILELSGEAVLHTKVLEILDVSSTQVEDWAKLLEKQGLLDIEYSTTGGVLYRLKGALPQQKKESSSSSGLFSSRKRKIIFLVILLMLIVLILVYYFFSDILIAYLSGGEI